MPAGGGRLQRLQRLQLQLRRLLPAFYEGARSAPEGGFQHRDAKLIGSES